MVNTNVKRPNDYLDVLMWLETASEDVIAGAYWLASGAVKEDMRTGIQSLMAAERPALALYFPELVKVPTKLAELPTKFPEAQKLLERLLDSLMRREKEPHYPLMGSGALSSLINELKDQEQLTADQSTLLLSELAALAVPGSGFSAQRIEGMINETFNRVERRAAGNGHL